MKRNFNAVLMNVDGTPFKDGNPKYKVDTAGHPVYDENSNLIILEEAPNLTLKNVALLVLGQTTEDEGQMSMEDKVKFFNLAKKIIRSCDKGEPVDLTVEEINTIQTRIGKLILKPFVVGAALEILNEDFVEPEAPRRAKK